MSIINPDIDSVIWKFYKELGIDEWRKRFLYAILDNEKKFNESLGYPKYPELNYKSKYNDHQYLTYSSFSNDGSPSQYHLIRDKEMMIEYEVRCGLTIII